VVILPKILLASEVSELYEAAAAVLVAISELSMESVAEKADFADEKLATMDCSTLPADLEAELAMEFAELEADAAMDCRDADAALATEAEDAEAADATDAFEAETDASTELAEACTEETEASRDEDSATMELDADV
jgi:hypothetical protein